MNPKSLILALAALALLCLAACDNEPKGTTTAPGNGTAQQRGAGGGGGPKQGSTEP